jgi:hypothetical protein
LAETATGIADSNIWQLKVQQWQCFACQKQNLTSGPCACGLDYQASVLSIAKVWVNDLLSTSGHFQDHNERPIDFKTIAQILLIGPRGMEDTRLMNLGWFVHDAMQCNECIYDPETKEPAVNKASAASSEEVEDEMNEETEKGDKDENQGESAGPSSDQTNPPPLLPLSFLKKVLLKI